MEPVLAAIAVSMSEFKMNPAAVIRKANSRPVVVLRHNQAAFYALEPKLFEAMLDELADKGLHHKAASRLTERSRAIEVGIDDL